MKVHCIILSIVFLSLFVSCSPRSGDGGQEANNYIVIDNSNYDFGILSDSTKILKHTFTLYNKSSKTCHITNITKSCGCTSVICRDSVIEQGDSVFIDVEIDVHNLYNRFEKSISVFTSFSKTPFTASVSAFRLKPKEFIETQFPHSIGSSGIRLSGNRLYMGYVKQGAVVRKSVSIFNSTQSVCPLKTKLIGDNSLIFTYCPEEILPKEVAEIIVIYDASEVSNIWGEQDSKLVVSSGACNDTINIYGILTGNTSNHSNCTPKINLSKLYWVLSDSELRSDIAKQEFEISNSGCAELVIHDIQTVQGVSYFLSDSKIKSKGVAKLSIEINTEVLDKQKLIYVGISSNDCMWPYKTICISKTR
ncbi:MAG: DUF1573 domain-containing protein [Muribaculaceae bacterium]|nr:DUF1573 domain-containing protein [Muribaculaceae bacterium]